MNNVKEQYYRIKEKMDDLEKKFGNIQDKFQLFSIFALACSENDMDTVRYLTQSTHHKHLIHPHLTTGLINACISNHLNIVRYLLTDSSLTTNVPVSVHDNDALIFAASKGNIEIVKYLLTSPELKQHADINAQADKTLYNAVKNDYKELIDYLLYSLELKTHSNPETAFINALRIGNIEVIEKFYSKFPNLPIYSDDEMIFFAAFSSNNTLDIIKYLIFEKGLIKNKNIESILANDPNPQIEQWFELSDVNNELNQNLMINNNPNRRNKV
jgi:ankyrin repeat protein